MYSVWFQDLEKVIWVLHNHLPQLTTFNSIKGNADGDFVIKTDTKTYIVRHCDFSIWRLDGSWKNGNWTQIS